VGTLGDNAILEVADEGPGMSQDDAHRVFERFYRTDSSRARSSGGTGLGLSIVDSLVSAHGGTVTVTTAPGRGSCFRVSLPRYADAHTEASEVDQEASPVRASSARP
jgi:two-component system OmpR family sensor kinase